MSQSAIRLAIIVGSTRPGRVGIGLANWALRHAEDDGFDVDLVDLAERDIYSSLGDRIAAADAFLVATPEYNHGYPAPLKAAIDAVQSGWQAKPVAFFSYGGISGGLRAVEQLRQVFSELQAVTIRNGIVLPWVHSQLNGEGEPKDPMSLTALKKTLAQLSWWAVSLNEARLKRDYVA